eukprot:6010299-Alexandrium_andersonii.AAC.1
MVAAGEACSLHDRAPLTRCNGGSRRGRLAQSQSPTFSVRVRVCLCVCMRVRAVSYTHLRAHETSAHL